jgi:hypothetical protein
MTAVVRAFDVTADLAEPSQEYAGLASSYELL